MQTPLRYLRAPELPGNLLIGVDDMSIDLSQMSQAELAALIAAASEQQKRKQREQIGEVRRTINAMAKEAGYTIEELFGFAKPAVEAQRKKVEAKYRNTSNPAETWSGRGKQPRWMEAAVAGGKTRDDFKI